MTFSMARTLKLIGCQSGLVFLVSSFYKNCKSVRGRFFLGNHVRALWPIYLKVVVLVFDHVLVTGQYRTL